MEQSKFYQIKNVTEHEYTLVGCDGSVITRSIQEIDKSASAFNIEDANDGDVLCLGGVIAIFKKYIGQEKCICYCSFCEEVGFEIPIENGEDNVYGCTNTTPATKERRDLLFAKMKEAGYEWNADKKELIKL